MLCHDSSRSKGIDLNVASTNQSRHCCSYFAQWAIYLHVENCFALFRKAGTWWPRHTMYCPSSNLEPVLALDFVEGGTSTLGFANDVELSTGWWWVVDGFVAVDIGERTIGVLSCTCVIITSSELHKQAQEKQKKNAYEMITYQEKDTHWKFHTRSAEFWGVDETNVNPWFYLNYHTA